MEEAAREGRAKDVEELIGLGSDVNAKDRYGQTALMLAAESASRETVEHLISAGAQIDAVDRDRKTVDDYARKNANSAVHSLFQGSATR